MIDMITNRLAHLSVTESSYFDWFMINFFHLELCDGTWTSEKHPMTSVYLTVDHRISSDYLSLSMSYLLSMWFYIWDLSCKQCDVVFSCHSLGYS